MLIENPWDGGAGYTPQQVAQMTPGQIWFRLVDKKIINKGAVRRTAKMEPGLVRAKADKDGMISARDADGNPIKLRSAGGGKSLARQLMEKASKKRKKNRKGR